MGNTRKRAYPEHHGALERAVALPTGTEAPDSDPTLLVNAGMEVEAPGASLDLGHDLSIGQEAAIPHSVPGPLDPHRWPGLRDAVAACNAAVARFPAVPDANERYLYLHDLGGIPETGWSVAEAEAVRAIQGAETHMCNWRGWARTPNDLGKEKHPRLSSEGDIQWEHLMGREEVAAWKAVRAGGPQPFNSQIQNQFREMDALFAMVEIHREKMALIRRRLGLNETSGNPTVQGRTWLVQWPVVEAVGLEGTRMRNEAALVVAAPRAILVSGATVMLTLARDLGAEDADLYPTHLTSFTLRLNETQRLAWGPSMHRLGKVYWTVQDEANPQPARKAGRKKKEKPEPPEE